ncbi:DUF3630 family protein [Thalassotalea aquiviva]|uniref:DUF3630 family protein n=1 Tax=Thalassotalea aquiviva TaxID=3242415 RepID=UPI00352B0D92
MQQLMSIERQDNEVIGLRFSSWWQQEDIEALSQQIFAKLPTAKISEHVIGADREYFRFRFQQGHFILHFESYANGCWIEPEDQLSVNIFEQIETLLNSVE